MIYVLRNQVTGNLKIGYSATVESTQARLRVLQCATDCTLTLVALVPGDRLREERLHDRFRAQRIRGEWFRSSPELEAWLDGGLVPSTPNAHLKVSPPSRRAQRARRRAKNRDYLQSVTDRFNAELARPFAPAEPPLRATLTGLVPRAAS